MDLRKIINSVKNTVLLIAALHLILLTIYTVSSGNFVYFNLANILDLKLFFPNLQYDSTTGLIGFITVLVLILINYFLP